MSLQARAAFRQISPTPEAWARMILDQYALTFA